MEGVCSQKQGRHRPPRAAAPQPTAEWYLIASSGHMLLWKRGQLGESVGTHIWWPGGWSQWAPLVPGETPF